MEEKEYVLTHEPGSTDDLKTETTALKSGSSVSLAQIIREDEENG